MQAGEVDAEGAILHAAVHAWYEGHIEGEDVCPGCDFRGDIPRPNTVSLAGQRFTKLTDPTPVQAGAFELLGVPIPLTLTGT